MKAIKSFWCFYIRIHYLSAWHVEKAICFSFKSHATTVNELSDCRSADTSALEVERLEMWHSACALCEFLLAGCLSGRASEISQTDSACLAWWLVAAWPELSKQGTRPSNERAAKLARQCISKQPARQPAKQADSARSQADHSHAACSFFSH